ncbi:MAG: hypothetical protein A2W80_07695 [Candidatus Riflebacteria bacterium GWC2_50_8]|nr:MAG: hypothetical protein A2W80_07695 [Candidatus Riflebacteria bacterium GWC2_50_8]
MKNNRPAALMNPVFSLVIVYAPPQSSFNQYYTTAPQKSFYAVGTISLRKKICLLSCEKADFLKIPSV